jgi:LmbE family N-acetylglucosaminyl deacetylase
MDVPGQPPLNSVQSAFSVDLPTPEVALAIGAHPDDIEFGCAGTLAKWAAAGCVVHHLVLTDGSKGSWDPNIDVAALVARRADEQRAAAAAIGATGTVVMLEQVDGELAESLEQRSVVAQWIRRLRPEVVFAHDPWRRYRLHPDHRHGGFLAIDALVAARDPHFFPEHALAPHRPRHLLLFEAEMMDHVENVSGWVGHKLRALEAHESQFESTMGAASGAGLGPFRDRIRARLGEHGQLIGAEAAESWKLLRAR